MYCGIGNVHTDRGHSKTLRENQRIALRNGLIILSTVHGCEVSDD